MRILGIDPGFGLIGFGLVEVTGQAMCAEEWGTISTTIGKPDQERLMEAYTDFVEVLNHFKPDVVAIERIFYFRNATTIIPVTQARGVLLLALAQAGLSYYEYTPMQVKQSVTGSGKSKKPEVQDMVARVLSLEAIPRPDDAADALAIAVCHHMNDRGGTAQVSVSSTVRPKRILQKTSPKQSPKQTKRTASV